MLQPMMIKKDSHGETHIEEIKGGQPNFTIDRIRQLEEMDPEDNISELSNLPTHEKVIWLKLKLDKEAPRTITTGANEISVSRENLLSDSLSAFKEMH